MPKKVRIIFDANPLVRQKTGVGFYTEGMVKALAAIPELELIGHYFTPRGSMPSLPTAANLSYSHNSWAVGMAAKALRKLGLRLPWELLAKHKADILFFPDFTAWPSIFKTPSLLTIHDLTYFDHPEYVTAANLRFLRRFVKPDARKAARVLTISNFSKNRIIDHLGVAASKIIVEPIPPPALVKPKLDPKLPKDFILFIGTIEPRKNLGGLVDAYLKLPIDQQEKNALVIAGGKGWKSVELTSRIESLQTAGHKIISLGYVDEVTKAGLYSAAAAVVVPSIYEGFGMPLLEAMSYGAPVLASDLAVFKEVAGTGADYFTAGSVASLAKSLAKILASREQRQALSRRGLAQVKNYSWPAVANNLYQEIQKLLK